MQITGHSPPVRIFQDPSVKRKVWNAEWKEKRWDRKEPPSKKLSFWWDLWCESGLRSTSLPPLKAEGEFSQSSGTLLFSSDDLLMSTSHWKIQSWNLDGCGSHSSHPWQDERWYYHMNLLSGCTGVCVWVCVVNFRLYINQWKIWMCTVGLYTCHLDDVRVRLGI